MPKNKQLTPEEKKWLAASKSPKKLRRALRIQTVLAVAFALLLVAGAIRYDSPNSGHINAVLLVAIAAQLLAQLFNIYVTRNQLREHDRLKQEENSK